MAECERHLKRVGGEWHVSLVLASIILGVTEPTVRKWLNEDRPPPTDPETGMLHLRELGNWTRKVQTLKRGRGGGTRILPFAPPELTLATDDTALPGLGPKKEVNQDIRRKKLQGDKLELEIKERAGELIPVVMVKQSWSTIMTRVKTKMRGIPNKLAPVLIGETDRYEIQKKISREVDLALTELVENAGDPDVLAGDNDT